MFPIYFDEDSVTGPLVRALRARGVDVTTVREQGHRGLSDTEQLDNATALGRVLYSKNVRDFAHLHTQDSAAGRRHAGIIVVPWPHYDIGEQLRRLLKLLTARSSEEMAGAFEYLSSWD